MIFWYFMAALYLVFGLADAIPSEYAYVQTMLCVIMANLAERK